VVQLTNTVVDHGTPAPPPPLGPSGTWGAEADRAAQECQGVRGDTCGQGPLGHRASSVIAPPQPEHPHRSADRTPRQREAVSSSPVGRRGPQRGTATPEQHSKMPRQTPWGRLGCEGRSRVPLEHKRSPGVSEVPCGCAGASPYRAVRVRPSFRRAPGLPAWSRIYCSGLVLDI
jgi:hypothetical protein